MIALVPVAHHRYRGRRRHVGGGTRAGAALPAWPAARQPARQTSGSSRRWWPLGALSSCIVDGARGFGRMWPYLAIEGLGKPLVRVVLVLAAVIAGWACAGHSSPGDCRSSSDSGPGRLSSARSSGRRSRSGQVPGPARGAGPGRNMRPGLPAGTRPPSGPRWPASGTACLSSDMGCPSGGTRAPGRPVAAPGGRPASNRSRQRSSGPGNRRRRGQRTPPGRSSRLLPSWPPLWSFPRSWTSRYLPGLPPAITCATATADGTAGRRARPVGGWPPSSGSSPHRAPCRAPSRSSSSGWTSCWSARWSPATRPVSTPRSASWRLSARSRWRATGSPSVRS